MIFYLYTWIYGLRNDFSPFCTGVCTDPDVCQCNVGFEFRENSTYICDPQCDEGCLNGQCIGPNECQCDDGYVFATDSTIECVPHCEYCINGTCEAPNQCVCEDGFEIVPIYRYYMH